MWFLLILPYLGYKEWPAYQVSLRASAVVDDLRKAVKAAHASFLGGMDLSDLIVYRNKEAFDKRHVGQEEPLEKDFLVTGLGETLDEALVVAVPQSPRFSFPLCRIPFFNNINNATESGRWISFETEIPGTFLNKLYVRESYRIIESLIRTDPKKIIITGTPGTGKSLFLIYLLWNLVKEGKRVLLIYHPFTIYYDGRGGVFQFTSDQLSSSINGLSGNNTLWCLFDAREKTFSDLHQLPHSYFNSILSTYPQRDLVNDFKKSSCLQIFYMPTWSRAEMEEIAPVFPRTDWTRRFEILGGIPRWVLEDTKNGSCVHSRISMWELVS